MSDKKKIYDWEFGLFERAWAGGAWLALIV